MIRFARAHAGRSALAAALAAAAVAALALPASASTIENTASVTNESGITRMSTIVTNVRFESDLGVILTAEPNPILVGNTVTFAIRVENFGPSEAASFAVEIRVPGDLTFDAAASSCELDGGGAICGGDPLAVGSVGEFDAVFTFPGDFAGPIDAIAAILPDFIDPVEDNDRDVLTVRIDRPFFLDGFEDGTADAWSNTVGMP
ncbi:MAG: hypothetical protein AAGF23_06120 [Acidobacteriota bacterium]